MDKHNQPLVSCIMPTYNRREFIPNAITYFLRQTYINKELIIIDDGSDSIADLLPDSELINYVRLHTKTSLGKKLNMACTMAKGDIIANWDDDDWYAPHRLEYQVNELLNNGTQLCGINNLLYYDTRRKAGYEYTYPADQRVWLLGSSLCYTRELWSINSYAEIDVGMDGLFVWNTRPEYITVLSDATIAVHMIHDKNASPKQTDNEWWKPYPLAQLEAIMQDDWARYHKPIIPQRQTKTLVEKADVKQSVRNINACLIHESEECVIDLVLNLYHNDPSSAIIIYNGGSDFDMSGSDFPFEKYNACFHPTPQPMQHGYLHTAALDCMEYAIANFDFEAFTIVDSDQLSVCSGYGDFICDYLSGNNNAGMLSNRPERITYYDTDVFTSIQAFREYDLWEPLFNTLTYGRAQFVHWTFWPSTVFTSAACADLVKLFKENEILKRIMQHTQIWATEEIILPTLVNLLGYDIVQNPCSHNYVQYRQTYTLDDAGQCFATENAYWIHPVERRYDDALRAHIRQRLDNYQDTEQIKNSINPVLLSA
ncbi:glycosyltransferase family 2 protein [Mucilaginibacter sp. JRF]|uniref:glycosyltransferase family 2 protein n=1 Tax=Mucilaginibacter sp. JRF TaxID=2780088 RepID=UPI001881213D|nr:glycosyltransferase family 2 protein [Mucilaginibacter sp. JRF]MBE9586619.1 glycosyltransferase family 2 protein [Mucilaginibacter sp. JRF]